MKPPTTGPHPRASDPVCLGEAQEFICVTGSQVMPTMVLWGPHLENQPHVTYLWTCPCQGFTPPKTHPRMVLASPPPSLAGSTGHKAVYLQTPKFLYKSCCADTGGCLTQPHSQPRSMTVPASSAAKSGHVTEL